MHGCRHGIGVVNGTVSLRIALMAAGIQAEDEVIVPPYTFLATATAVVEANAVPVFADIDLETFNLDPNAVEAAITPRTRAIIPVHMAGQPADMEAHHGHCREAQPDRHRRRCPRARRALPESARGLDWSPGFVLVSIQQEPHLRRGRHHHHERRQAGRGLPLHSQLRTHRGGLWYEHHVISGNYRLGEFQGAVLNAQLDRLEEQTKTRDRNGQYLAARLSRIPGIHPQQRPADCTRHSYHLFLFRIEAAGLWRAARGGFSRPWQAEGIPVSGGYALPLIASRCFSTRPLVRICRMPRPSSITAKSVVRTAKRSAPNKGAWLEQSLLLGTQSDMDDIARAFEKVYENRSALSDFTT